MLFNSPDFILALKQLELRSIIELGSSFQSAIISDKAVFFALHAFTDDGLNKLSHIDIRLCDLTAQFECMRRFLSGEKLLW